MVMTGTLQRSEKHTASKALFGVAVLYLVPGLLYWPVAGLKFDLNDWVRILGCVFLLTMGLLARRSPLVPVIICTVLFIVLLGVQTSQGIPRQPIFWILHGAIGLLLLVGLVSAI